MQTADLIDSSYRLSGRELEKYREIAGQGIFRLSVGLEDAADLCADLDRVL
jgi:cystathionine beta-lyase/cystathionine gamma-synthase